MKKSFYLRSRAFIFASVIAVSALCFNSGCSKNPVREAVHKAENSSQTEQKLKIGFSIDTLAIERWQRDLDVFMSCVKELGAECIVQNAGNSVEEQIRQLNYLVECSCDVIVVLPKEASSLTEVIEKIHAKGIPVISYDRLLLNCPVDLYITVDSEQVGKIMAEEMLALTDAKSYYCILGPEEDYNMSMIQSGISKVLEKTDVKIADTFYVAGWNYDLAKQKMMDLLLSGANPEVIICGNDAVADSVLSVLKNYYPEHHILICGQDADIAACQNIVRGEQCFTVYKPITHLAEQAALYAVELAEKKSVDEAVKTDALTYNGYAEIKSVFLEPVLVDSSNIDEVIIESGFHTYGEIYR